MKPAERVLGAGKHWALVGCGGGVGVSDETVVWGEGGEMDGSELNRISTSGG